MAKRKVIAREAMLLRAEYESDAGAAGWSAARTMGARCGKRDDGLLGLAASEGAGAEDESAIGDGLR